MQVDSNAVAVQQKVPAPLPVTESRIDGVIGVGELLVAFDDEIARLLERIDARLYRLQTFDIPATQRAHDPARRWWTRSAP